MLNQSVLTQSIIERSMGIVQLDDATYEEIEHDAGATTQAAIVVAIVGLAGGIGALGDSVWNIILGPIGQLISWAIISIVIYFVGSRLIPSDATDVDLGQVLRLMGFASVPALANVVGFIPVIGAVVVIVAWIWGIVCAVKAIKHALEMSTERAIATAVIAVVIATIPLAIVGVGVWSAT